MLENKIKKITPRFLLTHLIITLAYPAARSLTAQKNSLLVFTDALTITGLILIIAGIAYGFLLRGDFDISGFLLKRGASGNNDMNYALYKEARKEQLKASFNYPLFLGILYLLISAVLAYAFL